MRRTMSCRTPSGPLPTALAIRRCAAAGALALLPALLAGCADAPLLQPGWTEAEVRAQLGAPTGRYPAADAGTRLEYARGPMGLTTWMVDLDAQGRVRHWQQVLDRAHFARVQPGMGPDELLRELGRPAVRQPNFAGRSTWYWRFVTYDCEWFAVTFDPQGRVLEGGAFPPDPLCARPLLRD